MSGPSRVVLMQNELGQLGGISTFCKVVGEGLLARGYSVEIAALEPARAEAAVEYDGRIKQWTALDRSLEGARTERDARMKDVWRNACEHFASYDSETIVVFTQLFVRERIRPAWEDVDARTSFRSIVQYHGSYAMAASCSDLRRAKSVFSDADLFLLLTPGDAQLFQKAGFNNTNHIVNPIRIPDQELAPLATPTVVSLGRYETQKRLDHSIKAWRLLSDDFPEWTLDLYGSGPLHGELQSLIAELGLDQKVRLMGRAKSVMEVLRGASINLLSSEHEGLPFALMEASAAGVPSVSYDCAPGVREVVSDNATGRVVRRNDVAELSSGLRELMRDSELRKHMGAAARLRIQEHFELDVVLDKWEQIFGQVLR